MWSWKWHSVTAAVKADREKSVLVGPSHDAWAENDAKNSGSVAELAAHPSHVFCSTCPSMLLVKRAISEHFYDTLQKLFRCTWHIIIGHYCDVH